MLIGVTRVRNEERIILDTLNHWGKICDGGIYVYDDVSTDKTVDICRQHPSVKYILRGSEWRSNRAEEEFKNRQAILEEVLKVAKSDDWIVYFDADEFLYEFDLSKLSDSVEGVRCRLFDVYITPEDVTKPYSDRQYVGPEYRDILFFFKVSSVIGYRFPDQRECSLKEGSRLIQSGYIKHFGKGYSIQQWEDTCDYYANHFPMYAEKWKKRKGKAIHTRSDFGANLIRFTDILSNKEEGYKL